MKYSFVFFIFIFLNVQVIWTDLSEKMIQAIEISDISFLDPYMHKKNIDECLKYAKEINNQQVVTFLQHKKEQFFIHDNFFKTILNKKESGQILSPTESLFLKWCLYKSDELATIILKVDRRNRDYLGFQNMMLQVAKIESEMLQKGYITFVHARSWQWNFVKDVWNLICAVKQNLDTIPDRIHLRYRNQLCDVEELYKMRKTLLVRGTKRIKSCTNKDGKEAELTFMNRTPISNIKNCGECSGCYFLQNRSVRDGITGYDFAKRLLSKYGFDEYKKDIDVLYQLHQALTDYGEMICISVHTDYLANLVYVVKLNGRKHHDIKQQAMVDYLQISQQRVASEDNFFDDGSEKQPLIYCFAVTDIPGENEEAYKMQSVHFADPEKYQEYKTELQKLFDHIKKNRSATIK